MCDAAIREAQRRFQETRTARDEASWVAALLRAGRLERERVALAAYLGHVASQRVLSVRGGPADPRDLLSGLAAFGDEVCLRALVAMAPLSDYARTPERPPIAVERVGRETAWVGFLCDRAHLDAVKEHAEDLLAPKRAPFRGGFVVGVACRPERRCTCTLLAFPADRARNVLAAAIMNVGSDPPDICALQLGASITDLRAIVRRRLIPWALARDGRPG